MVIYWWGGLQVFSEPLSKSSWWLSYVFIITVHPVAFVPVDDATLLCDGIFVFRSHPEAFDGITSLAVHLYPMYSAYIFYVFTQLFYIWDHHIGPLIDSCCIGTDVSSLFFWSCCVGALIFIFTLFRAHIGYLFSSRTLCRWSSSFSNSWELEHTALALWCNVFTTPYFAAMVWWLSHYRYQSVWVGFLYTVALKLPSGWGMTRVSRKGMDPSLLLSSMMNCILSSMEFMCSMNPSLCAA